jgi:hypothetical protein
MAGPMARPANIEESGLVVQSIEASATTLAQTISHRRLRIARMGFAAWVMPRGTRSPTLAPMTIS